MTYTEIRSEPRQRFFCDKKSIYYIPIFVAITWFKRFFTISGASDLIAGTSGGRQLATASWTQWIKKQSSLFQRNGLKTGTKCLQRVKEDQKWQGPNCTYVRFFASSNFLFFVALARVYPDKIQFSVLQTNCFKVIRQYRVAHPYCA